MQVNQTVDGLSPWQLYCTIYHDIIADISQSYIVIHKRSIHPREDIRKHLVLFFCIVLHLDVRELSCRLNSLLIFISLCRCNVHFNGSALEHGLSPSSHILMEYWKSALCRLMSVMTAAARIIGDLMWPVKPCTNVPASLSRTSSRRLESQLPYISNFFTGCTTAHL